MDDQQVLARHRAAVEALPGTRPMSELRRLWLAAADADEALSDIAASPFIDREGATWDRLEDAQQDTRHALLDYLLLEHGLTTADLKRNPL